MRCILLDVAICLKIIEGEIEGRRRRDRRWRGDDGERKEEEGKEEGG